MCALKVVVILTSEAAIITGNKPAKVPVDLEIVSLIPHLQLGKYGGAMPESLAI